ncbi:MAG: hypothetical protein HQ512_10840 [Rhodospirillales bacterium]|nr:hypothetical protein [Rhodospirillales bacterium]
MAFVRVNMREPGTAIRIIACFAGAILVFGVHPALGAEKKNPWKAKISFGVEFDDNVNTSQTDNNSGQGDKAGIMEFSTSYKLIDEKKFGLEAGYDFFQSLYQDLDDFDLHSHSLSLFANGEVQGLDLNAYYGYSRTLLGRNDFLGLHNFQPSVGYSVTPQWYVTAGLNYQNKNFVTVNTRDANLYAALFDSFYFFNNAKSFVKVGYKIENENTRDSEFDYLGHYLNAEFKTPLDIILAKSILKLRYQYYFKDFRNITAEIGKERLDRRHTLRATFVAPLNDNLAVETDLKYIRALSSLEASDFVERVATVSLKLSY